MSIIRTPEPAQATGAWAERYAGDLDALGYVPSHTRVMATNPRAHQAFEDLTGAVAQSIGLRLYELVTLAAAGAIGSEACRLAHGRKSRGVFDDAQLERIALDYHAAGLTELEVAAMELAEKISGDSAAITEQDTLRLRELGLDDRQIVDVVLAAAARNYFSRALHALAVVPDVPPDLPDSLREALLTGLPTSDGR
ncbi:carboxymuconolactone decarboxylase family protein [Promicromonospora kroppenstedtii]|uniref:Carboxymuconolactone decarboxylase family protein n=1 Tax=Promicromonospora kroppenstedtii TaxID=440482 RepID=A0ABW7XJ65_9MICO